MQRSAKETPHSWGTLTSFEECVVLADKLMVETRRHMHANYDGEHDGEVRMDIAQIVSEL